MCCFPWCCCKNNIKCSIVSNKIKLEPSDISEIQNVSPLSNKRRSILDKKNNRTILPPREPKKKVSLKRMYVLKDKFRCLFCGWASCKHEDWRKNKQTAIIGLNCNMITGDLFASQRPSTILIKKYNLIKAFKELNIGLIVNVQRQGEHPYCGPNKGLEEISGFTYNPESFTTEGIRVRLSGWKDMNVPNSIPFMLEIVKDMLMTVKGEGRKVLVHCHAGYGRTGIVLACYMIFTSIKTAESIVEEIRKVRKDCVQKKAQMEYCITFKNYIDRAREIFTSSKKDIDYFIKHQVDLSYGEDVDKFQHVPKILDVVFEKILEMKMRNQIDNIMIYESLNGSSEWVDDSEIILVELKINLNKGSWICLEELTNLSVLTELCYDWLEDCCLFVINPTRIEKLFREDPNLSTKLKQIIADPRDDCKEERKQITKLIKNELRMIEFETLTCIAHFAGEIFPENDIKQKEDFQLMLEKLSIYILGFTIDYLYENPIKSQADKLKSLVDNMINLIFFCIIIMKYDMADDNNMEFYKLQTGNSDNLSQYIARKQMEEVNTSRNNSILNSGNQIDITKFLSKYIMVKEKRLSKSSRNSINKLTTISEKIPNGTILSPIIGLKDPEKDKDQFLYDIYKSLNKYFEKKYNSDNKKAEETICDDMSDSFAPMNNQKYTKQSLFNKDEHIMDKLNIPRESDNVEMLNEFYDCMFKHFNLNNINNFPLNPDSINNLNKLQRASTKIKNVYININGNTLEKDKNNEIATDDINNGTELEELRENKSFFDLFKEKNHNFKYNQPCNGKLPLINENEEKSNSKFSFNIDEGDVIKLKRIEDSDIPKNNFQIRLNKEELFSLSNLAKHIEMREEEEEEKENQVNITNSVVKISINNEKKHILSSKELQIAIGDNDFEARRNNREFSKKLKFNTESGFDKIFTPIELIKTNSSAIQNNDKNMHPYIRPKSRLRTIRLKMAPQWTSKKKKIQQTSICAFFTDPNKFKSDSKENSKSVDYEDKEINEKTDSMLVIKDEN